MTIPALSLCLIINIVSAYHPMTGIGVDVGVLGPTSALSTDVRLPTAVAAPGSENTTTKEVGAVCVFNMDCVSGCCIYANSASGMCVARATIGQVCGFIYGADSSLDTHYRICQQCGTECCCGSACCPTEHCLKALQLKPYVCSTCNTGCCCNDTCCPVLYCASSGGGGYKEQPLGKLCLRCQSGCCCGDSCCVSSFCKGIVVGQFCATCATGCCCDNNLCCSASYCRDTSALSVARTLLSMFDSMSQQNNNNNNNNGAGVSTWPMRAMPNAQDMTQYKQNGGGGGDDGLAAALYPLLAPAPLRVLGGGFVGTRIKAHVCLQCTTGCCCEIGCCSYIYCTVRQ